jgi:hypothetical protein
LSALTIKLILDTPFTPSPVVVVVVAAAAAVANAPAFLHRFLASRLVPVADRGVVRSTLVDEFHPSPPPPLGLLGVLGDATSPSRDDDDVDAFAAAVVFSNAPAARSFARMDDIMDAGSPRARGSSSVRSFFDEGSTRRDRSRVDPFVRGVVRASRRGGSLFNEQILLGSSPHSVFES